MKFFKVTPEKMTSALAFLLESVAQHHVPEHLGQLGVRQGQGPEPEVGGGVRHAPKHVLDRVDGLMDHDVAKGLVMMVSAAMRGFRVLGALLHAVSVGDHLRLVRLHVDADTLQKTNVFVGSILH